jgi:hypothetical protein
VGQYVGEVVGHLRRRENGGNGDPLMALDVAVHTGKIEGRRAETSDEQDEDNAELKREFLADGEATKPTGRHSVCLAQRTEGCQPWSLLQMYLEGVKTSQAAAQAPTACITEICQAGPPKHAFLRQSYGGHPQYTPPRLHPSSIEDYCG